MHKDFFLCLLCLFVVVIHAGAEHLPNVPPRNTFLTRIVVDSLVNEDFHRKQAEARSLLKGERALKPCSPDSGSTCANLK